MGRLSERERRRLQQVGDVGHRLDALGHLPPCFGDAYCFVVVPAFLAEPQAFSSLRPAAWAAHATLSVDVVI